MSYNLETINQAWYIACDEATDDTEGMEDGAAMLYILDYAHRHIDTILRDAGVELKTRRDRQIAKDDRPMSENWWLDYLRANAGTAAAANLLFDVIIPNKLPRQQAVDAIANLLVAFGQRVSRLAREA